MNKISRLTLPVFITLISVGLLQGCSGHPGAGHWAVAAENAEVSASNQYTALELEFDGKGTLHPNKAIAGQENDDNLHCLWQAKSAVAVEVQCANDTTAKENVIFQLVVGTAEEAGAGYPQANLLKDNAVVSQFIRKR